MRGLANAAVEGLLVCDGDVIDTVNNSFARLAGASAEALTGVKLAQFFPDEDMRRKLIEQPNQSIEGELMHVDGSTTPAEMLLPIDYGEGRTTSSRYATCRRASGPSSISATSRITIRSLAFPIVTRSTKHWITRSTPPCAPVSGSLWCASISTASRR